MLYRITHTTRFEYEEPAYDSQNELRMRPWDRDGQRCVTFDLSTNEPSSTLEYGDFFGNRAHSICVSAPHRKLEIVARSIVELETPPPPGATGMTLVEFLRGDAVRNNVYFEYLNPSQYIPFSERLRKFFWMARPQEAEDVGLYVARMMAYVRDQFEYETTATHVHSNLNDILDSGGGVCQDFAHLTIGILRLAGIPARYVSGYLAPASAGYVAPTTASPIDHMPSPPGPLSPPDVTAQASHAWLEAWLPGTGWTGFDPTHRCAVDGRHIGVAVGRDYADVPPLRGVFRSDAVDSMMTVDLNVEAVTAPILGGGSSGSGPSGGAQSGGQSQAQSQQ
jgi:transglutaminase-like putative cysteine protease